MRGPDEKQDWMFSYISAEKRVPKDHPLRSIRTMVDVILKDLSLRFENLYAIEINQHALEIDPGLLAFGCVQHGFGSDHGRVYGLKWTGDHQHKNSQEKTDRFQRLTNKFHCLPPLMQLLGPNSVGQNFAFICLSMTIDGCPRPHPLRGMVNKGCRIFRIQLFA